eukprot:9501154-Pyramimonas_sp.AAC.1
MEPADGVAGTNGRFLDMQQDIRHHSGWLIFLPEEPRRTKTTSHREHGPSVGGLHNITLVGTTWSHCPLPSEWARTTA